MNTLKIAFFGVLAALVIACAFFIQHEKEIARWERESDVMKCDLSEATEDARFASEQMRAARLQLLELRIQRADSLLARKPFGANCSALASEADAARIVLGGVLPRRG